MLQISLLKSSGAIILAKTNMAEWAFSPEISIGSVFGVVRNPYDLDRSTGGSSGGTAAGKCFSLLARMHVPSEFSGEEVWFVAMPSRFSCSSQNAFWSASGQVYLELQIWSRYGLLS